MTARGILLVHPTGNPFAAEAVQALHAAALLDRVVTSFAYRETGMVGSLVRSLPGGCRRRVQSELRRRSWIRDPTVSVEAVPLQEVIRVALTRSGLARTLGMRPQQLTDWVYTSIDRHAARHCLDPAAIQAIYAYEDGALESFRVAAARGIARIYDLPIVVHERSREIQREEAERFPDLRPALDSLHEPAAKAARKDEELRLAQHVIAASSVTRDSLVAIGIDPDKISVIPYGAPIDYFAPRPEPPKTFRALFVGRVGPRKGVHYLLRAWRELRLANAELLLIGVNEFPPGYLDRLEPSVRHIPSLPHQQLHEHYAAASVLVLPSLIEGFGLVLLEAMSCGVPIIATPHTAAPDIITDGSEGFIVPIRDVDALKARLAWCATNREALAVMGKAARRQAEALPWALYRQRLTAVVTRVLRGAR